MTIAISSGVNRLYNDLAWLWPIWEDVEEYREESELFAELAKRRSSFPPKTLVDFGCGGGKFAFHLKRHFEVTGIDTSESMLVEARKLNPDCEFVCGDMRGLRLGRQFDCVLIDDAVTYMTTEADLSTAFENAYRHLKAGGVMITFPDVCKDNFLQNVTKVSAAKASSKPANLDVVFIENAYDGDPDDNTYEVNFVFLIREDGELKIEHDVHICGLFKLDKWRELLKDAGFQVFEERRPNDSVELPIFVCVKTGKH